MIPPEKTSKPLVCWRFHGVWKYNVGPRWIKGISMLQPVVSLLPGVFRTPIVVLAFRKNPGCWKLTYTTSLWAFFSENSPEYVTKLYFKWLLNRVLFLYIKRFFSCVSKLSIQRRNFSVGKLKLSPSFCLVLVFEKIDEMFRRSMLVTDKNFLKIHCC